MDQNFYGPHRTEQEYHKAFNDARDWLEVEGKGESPLTAAHIFNVKASAFEKSVQRSNKRKKNNNGLYNKHRRRE
jgi:hypothetical protein